MKNKDQYFAEIVESSLYQWTAQSWAWNKFPSFGSIVVVEQEDKDLYAIVSQIQTGSSDPSRMPYAYQKTEQELLKEQPQIFELLRTVFTCIPIAYKCGKSLNLADSSFDQEARSPLVPLVGRSLGADWSMLRDSSANCLVYSLPVKPAKIHSFVRLITEQEKAELDFTAFLPVIFNNSSFSNIDELLLAVIAQKELDKDYIYSFIESYSLFCGNDYRRTKVFVKRIESLMQ